MTTAALKKSLESAQPVLGDCRIFRAESCLTSHNQEEKQKQKTPCIHSTPGGGATLRPLFFNRLRTALFAKRRSVTRLQHFILLGLRGFCFGALVSTIVACFIAQPSRPITTQTPAMKQNTAKACYHYSSDGKQRCV